MRNTRDTKLLFELSEAGRRAHRLPACDVPERPVDELLPAELRSPLRPLLCPSSASRRSCGTSRISRSST